MSRTLLFTLLLVACGGRGDDVAQDYASYPLAQGSRVARVSWNQGVEKSLYLAPGQFGSGVRQPPMIAGREALLRVAVDGEDDWSPRDVAVVLRYRGGGIDVELSQVVTVDGSAFDPADLGSGATFQIPPQFVSDDLWFDVSVHEVTPTAQGAGSVEESVWSTDELGDLEVVASDGVHVVLLPIRVGGREPDTSAERVAAVARGMMGMYPVTSVDVTVAEPINWTAAISPFSGWEGLLMHVSDLRTRAAVPENTYYYGLFDGADTIEQWCGQGCILGLSLLSPNPSDTWARASIGIGFPGQEAVDTLLHEVGHAHGREHAPCSLYGQPSDRNFPYTNARLGSWGYDITDGRLLDPQATADVMSYCSPIWVSDYTFGGLLDRVQALSGRARGATVPWQTVLIDGEGRATLGALVEQAPLPGGDPVELEWLDVSGEPLDVVEGFFLPFDHLPGGMALVPPPGRSVASGRLVP